MTDNAVEKTEEVVSPDQERLNRLDALAEKATSTYGGQPEPEAKTEPEPQVRDPETGQFVRREAPIEAAPEATEPVAEVKPEPVKAVEPDLSVMVTRKVNGVDVTKSIGDWINDGQKVSAADRYLAESAKAFRTVQQPAQAQAPAQPASVEEVDDAALARAIQTGTEEEAKAAIARLRKQPPQASMTPEQLLPLIQPAVRQQIEVLDAFRTFQTEFSDVVGDPNLYRLVQLEDEKLLRSEFQGSNLDRFRAAGTAIRKWRDSFAGQAMSEKQQRKATVTPLPTAAARATGKAEEKPESHRDVIADMAKQRMAR